MQPETDDLTDLKSQVEAWLRVQDGSGNQDQFAGILRTVLRLAADNTERGDLKI